MNIELSAHEARVIGCLIEKQITTPEQYPMSLNALTNACNQKSNRDPVLQLPESEVQALIDVLSRKHLLLEKSGFGSRVPKYQQRFCNTEFSVFQFTPQERAIVCELLLRGPQTPGELRSRAARMADFADAAAAEAALEALAQRPSGPLVRRLPREPGRRETRYAHLFGSRDAEPGASEAPIAPSPAAAPTQPPRPTQLPDSQAQRLAALEAEVRSLREELERLKRAR
ncbi:MAG: YceH family protein [Steroidobacterales bacterium]